MARVSTQELLSRLEKGKLIPAIVLLGEEPYLRDACRAKLIEAFVPEASRTWAVSRYSAERGETQAALTQAQSLPMLSPQQVIFLEDAGAIEKFGEKNRDETVEQLETYLGDPAPFTVLVIEAARLDERMKLAKVLGQRTLVVEVGLGDNVEQRQLAAVAMAGNLAKAEGLTFERGAAEDLAERVAADLMRLKTEIEKLAAYLGERKIIRREDVKLDGFVGKNDYRVGVGGFAGFAAREAGAGFSGSTDARRGRAGGDGGRDDVDVSQVDRGQRD